MITKIYIIAFGFILLYPWSLIFAQEVEDGQSNKAYYNKALEFHENKELDSALYYYELSGKGYRDIAEYPEAFQSFFQAYKIRDSLKTGDIALSLLYLGSVEGYRQQFKSAVGYFKRALGAAEEQGDTTRICQSLANLGQMFMRLEEYDSADLVLKYSLDLGEQGNLHSGWFANTYNTVGILHETQENWPKAFENYHKAYKIWLELDNSRSLASVYNNIGYAHYKLGDSDSAFYWLHKGKALSKKLDYKHQLITTYDNLAEVYESVGLKDSVIYNLNQEILLEKEVFNLDASKEIDQLRIKYESEKIARENEEQKVLIQEAKNRQRQLIIIALGLGILSLIIYLIYKRRENKREKALHKIGDLLKDQEIRSFHSVLDAQEKERTRIAEELHDKLGSTLSAAKLYFNNMEGVYNGQHQMVLDKGMELLDIAVQDVRMISHNMLSGVLSQFGLIPALQDLQNTITGSGQVAMKVLTHGVNHRMNQKTELHIYRIIQELVSNALKHSEATEIIIQLNQHEHELTITVEDNGNGFNESRMSDGIGLKNVSNRADLLNASLNIDTGKGKGTIITIDIPMP